MENWNDFEEFTQGASSSRSNVPRISLNNRGDITLNHLAHGLLKNSEKVVLAFSKKGLIGIRPANEGEKHAFDVKSLANSTSHIIRAKGFCAFYNIIPPKTALFEEITSDEIGIILDLNKVKIIAPRQRQKKSETPPKVETPLEQKPSSSFWES
ncbi:MAG: hypothetical protein LUM44_09845 [Pyrinomonadaceae bacterium]|nr:hypothetical protein [Pyrinomonadaceae bacterium]